MKQGEKVLVGRVGREGGLGEVAREGKVGETGEAWGRWQGRGRVEANGGVSE